MSTKVLFLLCILSLTACQTTPESLNSSPSPETLQADSVLPVPLANNEASTLHQTPLDSTSVNLSSTASAAPPVRAGGKVPTLS